MPRTPEPLTLVVAATSTSLGIGRSGALPWRLKADLSFFARVTKRTSRQGAQNAVLMGRKTWASIPPRFRPLPNRLNIVLSRTPMAVHAPPGVVAARSLEEALQKVDGLGDEVERIFVIGGAEVYTAAIDHPRTDSILMTRVENEIECDTFFPTDIKQDPSWKRVGHNTLCDFAGEEVVAGPQQEGDVKFEFELWRRSI